MKKLFYLSFATLAMLFSTVSCSDDDETPPPPPPAKTQLEEVIEKLGTIEDVTKFTEVLKNVDGANLGEDALTVFAVKDKTEEPAPKAEEGEEEEETEVTKDNITRHIVKGDVTFPATEGENIIVESVKGDPVKLTMKDGKVLVNDVALESTSATEAGKSKIYVVATVLPDLDIPEFKASYTVYEANEEWTGGVAEKVVSENAKITFYVLDGEEYKEVGSVATDKDGKAAFEHYYEEGLLYKVEKEGKTSLRDNYLLVGLFTTLEQIEEAPEYKTETALDKVALGSLRVADIDGDNIIDEKDKVADYLSVDNEAENTDLFIVSATYKAEEETEE
ncbi:fasciclin domain-containing protein [Prevotella sp. 10(H)]|uniref:fasciclin domain-containing protein n=1 Tax=Prevotella sp. 10(H) TaxID=1158294 RepID=UPI0004A7210A|nr:fasciclin domain-containing protein [Prevotella sp. 10(H)]